jgi:nicotinamide mononucleotide transporter
MSITEILGVLANAACVILVVRKSIWNFAFGIAGCAFFIELFYQSRLWWDMSLQGVFIALSIMGWISWARSAQENDLPIRRADPKVLLASVLLVALITPAMMKISIYFHGAAPFWDSLTTALSLVAQAFLNRKLFENWFFWIAADIIYIPLYLSRELYLTSFLYAIFLCLCLAGARSWRREMSTQELQIQSA